MGMFLLIGNSTHMAGFSRYMGLHKEVQDVRVHSTSKDALVILGALPLWCLHISHISRFQLLVGMYSEEQDDLRCRDDVFPYLH